MDSPKLTDQTTQSAVVRKANPAIAIKPIAGKLTIVSRRIYNLLLHHAQLQGIEHEEYSLPLSYVVAQTSSSDNNATIKTRLREMASTTIEWNSSPTGQAEDQEWNIASLLAAKITPARGGRPITLTWSYAPGVRRQLIEPKQYTRLLLQISAQLSLYSAAVLLEIGFQYLTSPGQLTMREDVDWWAAVLKGQALKKPVDYRFFKRDTLTPGIAEVNKAQTEFELELLEHRSGRKVISLQFRIHRRKKMAVDVADSSGKELTGEALKPVDIELFESLTAIGLREADAGALIDAEDHGRIRAAVQYTKARKNKIDAPAAYLRAALKHGYAEKPQTEVESEPSIDAGELSAATLIARVAAGRVAQEAQRNDYERSLIADAREAYASTEEAKQVDLRRQFGLTLMQSRRDSQSWDRLGIASPPLAARFFGWIAQQTDAWKKDVTPADEV